MTDLQPTTPPAPRHGWLIVLSALLGTILIPVAVWCTMLIYDQFDPMCGNRRRGWHRLRDARLCRDGHVDLAGVADWRRQRTDAGVAA
jgi:hypothetical protein